MELINVSLVCEFNVGFPINMLPSSNTSIPSIGNRFTDTYPTQRHNQLEWSLRVSPRIDICLNSPSFGATIP
jgi:hypothetical protein